MSMGLDGASDAPTPGMMETVGATKIRLNLGGGNSGSASGGVSEGVSVSEGAEEGEVME